MTIRISKIVTVSSMLTLSMIKKEYDSKEEGKWKVVERVRERSRHGEHERQTHTITHAQMHIEIDRLRETTKKRKKLRVRVTDRDGQLEWQAEMGR